MIPSIGHKIFGVTVIPKSAKTGHLIEGSFCGHSFHVLQRTLSRPRIVRPTELSLGFHGSLIQRLTEGNTVSADVLFASQSGHCLTHGVAKLLALAQSKLHAGYSQGSIMVKVKPASARVVASQTAGFFVRSLVCFLRHMPHSARFNGSSWFRHKMPISKHYLFRNLKAFKTDIDCDLISYRVPVEDRIDGPGTKTALSSESDRLDNALGPRRHLSAREVPRLQTV